MKKKIAMIILAIGFIIVFVSACAITKKANDCPPCPSMDIQYGLPGGMAIIIPKGEFSSDRFKAYMEKMKAIELGERIKGGV